MKTSLPNTTKHHTLTNENPENPSDIKPRTDRGPRPKNDQPGHAPNRPVLSRLSEDERRRYDEIKAGLGSAKETMAKLLHEARLTRVYREEYATFEAFAKREAGLEKRHANRLATWGHAMELLGPNGPTRESHARPLTPLIDDENDEAVKHVWTQVLKRWDTPTQACIAAVVKEYLETKRADDSDSGDDTAADDDSNSSDATDGTPLPTKGAYVVADSVRLASLPGSLQATPTGQALTSIANVTPADLQDLIETNASPPALVKSSAEAAIADSVWMPITAALTRSRASLPTSSEMPLAFLHLDRLAQLGSRRATHTHERALVCPTVDLFSPDMPDLFVNAVLEAVEDALVTPVLFTRHPARAASYSLPDSVWLGSPADRTSVDDVAAELKALPPIAVRWILYDVQNADWSEGPPTLPQGIDWVVFDPPGGSGVQLTLSQACALQQAAKTSGATPSFRRPFKTIETAYPA